MAFLNDKTYNIIKWVAQFLLPGTATLYFSLSKFWSLPMPEQVVGTIVAVDAFLGTLLGLSNVQYQKTSVFEAIKNGIFPQADQSHNPSPSYFLALPPKVYDFLKWGVIVFLPATGALYFVIAQIWGLPNAEAVVGSIASIDAFIGFFLGYNTSMYNKAVSANVDPDIA